MTTMIPIQYRELYDVPRIFLAKYKNILILFDCPFDEAQDEYPNVYKVYILPAAVEENLAPPFSWAELYKRATNYLGEIPVTAVKFDATLRREIDSSIVEQLLHSIGMG